MGYRLLLLVFALLGATPAAKAQFMSDAEWGKCTRSIDISPDVRITGCNDVYNRKECEKYLNLPDCDEIRFRRGQAYLDKGEYRLAIKDYDRAIKLRERPKPGPLPEVGRGLAAEVYLHRGVAYALLGDLRRAQQDVDEAGRLANSVHYLPEELTYRIKIISAHVTLVANRVEPASTLREMLETKINIHHEQ